MNRSKPFSYNSLYHLQKIIQKSPSVLVCGNGPSLANVDIPNEEKLIIFRSNWFFLNKNDPLGGKIDYYFASKMEKALFDSLNKDENLNFISNLKGFFTPFYINENANPKYEYLDHWSIIATDKNLARFMISRPLPTQGMQMIAVAAIAGAKKIYTTGIDFYSNNSERYAYKIPDKIKEKLAEKDYKGGYEKDHSLTNDVAYLKIILDNYDFEFDFFKNCKLPNELTNQFKSWKNYKNIITKNAKHTYLNNLKNKSAKTTNNKSFAYVTYVSDRYWVGALHIAHMLIKNKSKYPLVIMVDKEITKEQITSYSEYNSLNIKVYMVKNINNPNHLLQERFQSSYNKLNIFSLIKYKRLVFIDPDILVLKNIDDLFYLDEGFYACPDWGNELTDKWNSGLMVITPNLKLFEEMLSDLSKIDSYDSGDQGFLNQKIQNINLLPYTYNTLIRVKYNFPSLFDLDKIKCIHYVGATKPWDTHRKYDDNLWLENIDHNLLLYWTNIQRNFIDRRLTKINNQIFSKILRGLARYLLRYNLFKTIKYYTKKKNISLFLKIKKILY